MTNKVTFETLYSLVDTRTKEIMDKFDKLEVRVSVLEIWRAEVIGKIVGAVAVINLVIAISFDWIKKQIFKNNI